MTVGIYKFNYDTSRSGSISGLFLATREDISKLNLNTTYLGEVLGKHSEVYFEPNELKQYVDLVTEESEAIAVFRKYSLGTGYDLTDYLEDLEEE